MSTLQRNAAGLLPSIGVLRVAGADAIGFLQGQVSNDTRRLSEQGALLAAYSTPQGRVLCVLHLLPHSSGVLALLPRELAAPIRERWRRFVLRAKVDISDVSDEIAVGGVLDAAADAWLRLGIEPPQGVAYVEHQGVGSARVSAFAPHHWIVGTARDLAARGLGPDATVEARWRLANIRAGQPQIHGATSELFVAQMLNLDLIDGISFNKGCYTGQEIIARAQHRGRIKRRMRRLALPHALPIGAPIRLDDGRSGRIVECVELGGAAGSPLRVEERIEGAEPRAAAEALAVLTLEPMSAASAEAGAATDETGADVVTGVRELPLPYAL